MALRLIPWRGINRHYSAICTVRRAFSSSKDDDTKEPAAKTPSPDTSKLKKDEAVKRLNVLLEGILTEKDKTTELNLARPKNKRKPKEPPQEDIINSSTKRLDKKYVEAVNNIATSIEDNDSKNQTKSELLMKLLQDNPENVKSPTLSDLLGGMGVESTNEKPPSRADQVRHAIRDKVRPKMGAVRDRGQPLERFDLFSGERLNIFEKSNDKNFGCNLTVWQKLHQRELQLAVTHPPANYYQQMILWTNQGKIWKFPIDNEQDMNERFVDFTEHVFVEDYMSEWCPDKGPIRHFMELVCVGLSKNHYLSVEEKKAHVNWYRDYFADKGQLLMEIGAVTKMEKERMAGTGAN